MSFSEQSFQNRFATMGDTAEAVFEDVSPLGKPIRSGFRRPPGVRFGSFPVILRHWPDYVTPTHMIEVAGMGRDGVLKSVKVEKYEALKVWDKIARMTGLLGLALFVWNSSKKQWLLLSMRSLNKLVKKSVADLGVQSFKVDDVEYYPLPWDWMVNEAQIVGSYDGDAGQDT